MTTTKRSTFGATLRTTILMAASRAYEAGVTSLESLKSMARAALKIGR